MARYEAASAAVGETMFVMGGIGESSVEFVNAGRKSAKWQSGPSLPAVTARACAAAVDGDTVILSGGHGNGSAGSVRTAHMLSARDDELVRWSIRIWTGFTAWCKKIFPLFEIPTSFLPRKMASPCTANWP